MSTALLRLKCESDTGSVIDGVMLILIDDLIFFFLLCTSPCLEAWYYGISIMEDVPF